MASVKTLGHIGLAVHLEGTASSLAEAAGGQVASGASENQLAFLFLRKVRNIVWRSKNKFQCST